MRMFLRILYNYIILSKLIFILRKLRMFYAFSKTPKIPYFSGNFSIVSLCQSFWCGLNSAKCFGHI